MKLRKIFAGMSALAIASTMAISASAFNAGLFYQDTAYNYRDGYTGKDADGVFPSKVVGVLGGGGGFDDTINFTDTEITKDGHYTVSMDKTGGTSTIGDAAGTEWSLEANTFNMLGITTDFDGFELVDNDDDTVSAKCTESGKNIEFKNVKVTIGSTSYDADALALKSDNKDYLTMMIINMYDKPDATNIIGDYKMPAAADGITVEFDVVGLDADAPAETPAAETPAAETPAAETPAAETSAATTPAATTPAATPAATGNTTTGASAGLALAGLALAGAAVVVSKKR